MIVVVVSEVDFPPNGVLEGLTKALSACGVGEGAGEAAIVGVANGAGMGAGEASVVGAGGACGAAIKANGAGVGAGEAAGVAAGTGHRGDSELRVVTRSK
ncbi:unnamed protein product [Ectocarpus sp. CCAP 1310/34]|nr:unnamed protein product [Ectocarpus sp. CCAP 1310/34]